MPGAIRSRSFEPPLRAWWTFPNGTISQYRIPAIARRLFRGVTRPRLQAYGSYFRMAGMPYRCVGRAPGYCSDHERFFWMHSCSGSCSPWGFVRERTGGYSLAIRVHGKGLQRAASKGLSG